MKRVNNIFLIYKYKQVNTLLIFLIIFVFQIIGVSCTTMEKRSITTQDTLGDTSLEADNKNIEESIPQVKIREFILSPGDEISITVLNYDELNRKLIIPPDGYFFYPLVGEVFAKGKTLKELREIIRNGLSSYQEFTLTPGDEIAIAVYRNDELNRRLIIPPEYRFYYPLVGDIDTKGKTVTQLREIIRNGLSKFMVDPQVSVDIVAYGRSKVIVDPQVSVEVIALGGQKVFVLGEVNKPGVFTLEGGIDTIEAISRAGGFTLDARKNNVLLVRGGLDNPDLIMLNIEKFLKGADLTQNISLQRGDIVYVPASTIANVDRFFRHFSTIINPIVNLETGIVLSPSVEDAFTGKVFERQPTVIVPPR